MRLAYAHCRGGSPQNYAYRIPHLDLLKNHMSELCAYPPCKCLVAAEDTFCDEVCAMLAGSLVNNVRVSSSLPEEAMQTAIPRCACGHSECGDTAPSAKVH